MNRAAGANLTDDGLHNVRHWKAIVPAEGTEESRLFGLEPRYASAILGSLLALKLGLLFLLAWNTRFVMDEFQQLGMAKYLGNGLFDTVWHAKAVGYVVFYKIAHLLGWDATSILLIGRMQVALLACATLAIVYGCARALGHDRLRSLLVIVVLLCFSTFIERIFRTIAEPLAVFFAAGALLAALRGQADRAGTVIAAGMLSGLSFLATQKAVYFDVALGLALVFDAALARRYRAGIARGVWLLLGWSLPIAAYCFIFGGGDPARVALHLAFGPVEVATTGGDVYANLRVYVWQTLLRNNLLYLFCFAGLLLELPRLRAMDGRRRIALIFTLVVTAFVFAHNQPWPYVFIMALPFLALWCPIFLDRVAGRIPLAAGALVAVAVASSFLRNGQYLHIDNHDQLQLVARAEAVVGPRDVYFDGVAMLPNRSEPSLLWLDRKYVLKTLQEKQESEAYKIFAVSPPKVVLWSYRMEAIEPVVGSLIRRSYVAVAPNLRIAGRHLRSGRQETFAVPIAGQYQLYNSVGQPVAGQVEVDGRLLTPPVRLAAKPTTLTLRGSPVEALLLPLGSYEGVFGPGRDNPSLFAGVYD